MKKVVYFFNVILLFLIASCEKAPLVDSSVTTGAFSCKINGTFWETKNVSKEVLIRSEESPGVFFKTLVISGESVDEQLITLQIHNKFEAESGDCPGVYTYYSSGHEDYEEKAKQIEVDGIRYGDYTSISYFSPIENSSGSGLDDIEVTVTNCENYQVSGTFEGTIYAQNEEGTVVLRISEGRFENIPYDIQE